MKKIILILLMFFVSVNIVNASKLKSVNLPYYVLLDDEFIQVKKIYNEDNEVLFNINYKNYTVENDFKKYDKYKKDVFIKTENAFNHFKTIAHYGYNENPSDLNYYLTQVYIWQVIGGFRMTFVDENKNVITDYKMLYSNLNSKYNAHYRKPTYANKSIDLEIWDSIDFNYQNNSVILDNPINDNLEIKNNGNKINFYAKTVSNNKLVFRKTYDNESYCYSDGKNYYFQNIKGPESLEEFININVYGTKIKIKENLIGINNNVGDVSLNSKYELYFDNDLKQTFNSNEDIFVKSNSNYILKDISNNNGIINNEDLIIEVKEENLELKINKYVISKNVSLDINNDIIYYVYLKSNNKLYEKIDKNTDIITLPYGIYYITDKKDYYNEIVVDNMKDELIVIDNNRGTEISKSNNIIENSLNEEIDNPKTIDNIYFYVICFMVANFIILFNVFVYKKYI